MAMFSVARSPAGLMARAVGSSALATNAPPRSCAWLPTSPTRMPPARAAGARAIRAKTKRVLYMALRGRQTCDFAGHSPSRRKILLFLGSAGGATGLDQGGEDRDRRGRHSGNARRLAERQRARRVELLAHLVRQRADRAVVEVVGQAHALQALQPL